MAAAKNFGPQSESNIAKTYRDGLAALDRYCTANKGGKHFAELSDNDKDELLKGLESGKTKLEGADGKAFFEQALKDIQQGFFADPIYGGNRDMVAWKMIGFPGARYNYLDWIDRHNERYPLPPVGHHGPADWTRELSAIMAHKLPQIDVVIVGFGWTGAIMAQELTDAGLDVVAIERGPWRDTATEFALTYAQDELRYRIRHELFQRPAQRPSPSATS